MKRKFTQSATAFYSNPLNNLRRHVTAVGILVALLLSGCAIGPNYVRPAIETPSTYRGQSSPAPTKSLADLPWWDIYKDETLKDLIEIALTNNFDLRVAISRMEQARAIANQSRAQLMPALGYQYEAGRGRTMTLADIDTVDSASAVLAVSWEVDLWGRLRQLHGSDLAQYLASEENRRAVTMKLVGDVAQAYFELLELDLEMDIARQTTNSFGESLRIFSARFAGGVVSELEISRAEAALANAASYLPEIERQIVLKENQINVLLGRQPRAGFARFDVSPANDAARSSGRSSVLADREAARRPSSGGGCAVGQCAHQSLPGRLLPGTQAYGRRWQDER